MVLVKVKSNGNQRKSQNYGFYTASLHDTRRRTCRDREAISRSCVNVKWFLINKEIRSRAEEVVLNEIIYR